jgi:DNA-3-methyladenine glycosylase
VKVKGQSYKILHRSRLGRKFFNQPTLLVARKLLGCYLVRRVGGRLIRVRITETEAYIGPQDKANHAARGRTQRTEIMFGQPGRLYIYLIYGMYYCLNVVTEKVDYPAAVLIRAVQPAANLGNLGRKFLRPYGRKNSIADYGLNGPGRVCRYLKIAKNLNGEDVVGSQRLWFESGRLRQGEKIAAGKRIGVHYAGAWQHKLWRFILINK